MHNQMHHIFSRQAQAHGRAMTVWANQVRASRSPLDAARRAAHAPVVSGPLRAYRSLYSGEESRARNQVEGILAERISEMTPGEADWISVMRMMQGHWPRLHREMASRMHKES